jgi:DNA repair exonuclease SbcCD ATPase subunit
VRGLLEEIDHLFGLPLNEFTSARNELAQRLKREGDNGAADEIRALRKPSVSAWTINQLSRLEPDAVRDLLNAGDAVRKEQKRLLREAGKPDSLRDALAKERKAINSLTERARSILQQAGRPITEATLQRIAGTLQVAAVENDGRELLKTGRLTGDLEPTGFGAFTGVEFPPTRSGSTHDELSDRRRQKEEHQQRVTEAQQQLRELEDAARDAESEAKNAADAAAEAQRTAESARRAADDAAAELNELRHSGPRGGRPSG